MTSFNTYDAIRNRLIEVTEDTSQEFLDYIPHAIRAAELRMTKEIDTLALKKNVTLNTAIGQRVVAKPVGFRFTHDAFLYDSSTQKEKRLRIASDDYIRDFWPNAAQTAEPIYFAPDYENDNMLLGPTPDKVYELRVSCGADVTPLSASNQQNYFSINAGEVLFYAAMIEACIFLRNPMLKQDYEALYTSGMLAINNQGRRERRDDGTPPNNPSGGGNTLKGEN